MRLNPLLVLLLATMLTAQPCRADSSPVAPLIEAEPVQLLDAVRAPGAKAVVVNLWATWCLPCREEFPDLLRLRRAYADRGVRLVLVSGDFGSERPQVEAFLREQGVDFPTYLKTGSDMALIDAFDPQWSGALPATFIYDGQGRRRHSLFGITRYATFEENVNDVLRGGGPSPPARP